MNIIICALMALSWLASIAAPGSADFGARAR